MNWVLNTSQYQPDIRMDANLPRHIKTSGSYFSKEIFALKIFGVHLIGNEGIIYKIYSTCFVFGTVFLYSILDAYGYFTEDLAGISAIVQYQVAGCITFSKMTVVYRNRHNLMKLLARFEEEPFLANSKRGGDKEVKLIEECLWITKVQSYTYWIIAAATIIFTIVYGLVNNYLLGNGRKYELAYGSFNVVNTTYSPNYEIIYFYQCISIIYIAANFTSIDLLIAAILAHICYQFKILQNHIRHLTEICDSEMKEDAGILKKINEKDEDKAVPVDGFIIPWHILKKHLKKAITYHLAIIGISEETEKIFNKLFLIVFLGALALICFPTYGASAFSSNDPKVAVIHIFEGVCACLQVATVCYWGEQVLHESQEVGRAAMESNFVGTDLKYQRMLVLVIRRTHNPTKFSAGKFAIIGLATFFWILRTSYSSFMILRRANMAKS